MSSESAIFKPCADQSRLGLGGAPLGNLFTELDDAQATRALAATLESGCTSFDTAPHYGNGLSEHRFGRALRQVQREKFVLSSKVGRLLSPDSRAAPDQHGYVNVLPFSQRWDYSASGVRRSVLDSLQRLGLARLDVALIHDCDATVHGPGYPQVLAQVVGEALPELRRLQDEGLLRHVGLGVNDVQVCLDVLARADLDCLLLAGRYTLLDQSAWPALMDACHRRGVRVAIGGAFNSGILATGVRGKGVARFNYGPADSHWIDRAGAIEDLCERHRVPLRAAALQFPLAHPAVDLVVVGAQDADQWNDALAMMRHPIPPALWDALRAARLLHPDLPTP
jgi:D-threo-aldose 1-dehydrogenase